MKYVVSLAALFVAALYFLSSEKQKQEYKDQVFALTGKLKKEVKKGAKKVERAVKKGTGKIEDEFYEIKDDIEDAIEDEFETLD